MIKFLLVILVLITGCIGIPTDYPENEYYAISRINQEYTRANKFPYSIYMEQINMSSEYDDIFIKYVNANYEVEKYHYHRWISTPSDMIENYFTTLIIKSEIFSNGVYIKSKRTLPDFVLNIDVIQFDAYSENVEVLINFNLIKYQEQDNTNATLFQQSYLKSIERDDKSKASSIPKAFNEALNQISIEFLKDLIVKLEND